MRPQTRKPQQNLLQKNQCSWWTATKKKTPDRSKYQNEIETPPQPRGWWLPPSRHGYPSAASRSTSVSLELWRWLAGVARSLLKLAEVGCACTSLHKTLLVLRPGELLSCWETEEGWKPALWNAFWLFPDNNPFGLTGDERDVTATLPQNLCHLRRTAGRRRFDTQPLNNAENLAFLWAIAAKSEARADRPRQASR